MLRPPFPPGTGDAQWLKADMEIMVAKHKEEHMDVEKGAEQYKNQLQEVVVCKPGLMVAGSRSL